MKSQIKIEPACDRLRALIPLKEPITDAFSLNAVEKAMIEQFNTNGEDVIDESGFGRHRYFAHGTTDVSSFIKGRELFD